MSLATPVRPFNFDKDPCPACGKRFFGNIGFGPFCECNPAVSEEGLAVYHATGRPLWNIPREDDRVVGEVVFETEKFMIVKRSSDGELQRTKDKNHRCPKCAGHLVGLCTFEMFGGKIGECTSCRWSEPEPPAWMPPKPGESGYVSPEELATCFPEHATDRETQKLYKRARVAYQKAIEDPKRTSGFCAWSELDPREQLNYLPPPVVAVDTIRPSTPVHNKYDSVYTADEVLVPASGTGLTQAQRDMLDRLVGASSLTVQVPLGAGKTLGDDNDNCGNSLTNFMEKWAEKPKTNKTGHEDNNNK